MDQLQLNLEKWERDLRVFLSRSKETPGDPFRKMLLHQIVPEKVQEHLEIHGAKMVTYVGRKTCE